MISASGLRAMVEARVDFNNSRNMIIVSVILSLGLGLNSMSIVGDALSQYSDNHNLAKMFKMQIGDVEISPLAIATLVGIISNLVMPNKEEEKAQYTYINLQSDENETQDSENASILEDCSVESSESGDLDEVTASSEKET